MNLLSIDEFTRTHAQINTAFQAYNKMEKMALHFFKIFM